MLIHEQMPRKNELVLNSYTETSLDITMNPLLCNLDFLHD